MKVRLLPEAISDLELGVDFYESQAPGLGAYFLDSLISDLDSLELFGGIHAMDRGFHRSASKRFPFVIYYVLNGDFVDVYAVLDARQEPKSIDTRLKGP